jgi:hypothetical protein
MFGSEHTMLSGLCKERATVEKFACRPKGYHRNLRIDVFLSRFIQNVSKKMNIYFGNSRRCR